MAAFLGVLPVVKEEVGLAPAEPGLGNARVLLDNLDRKRSAIQTMPNNTYIHIHIIC